MVWCRPRPAGGTGWRADAVAAGAEARVEGPDVPLGAGEAQHLHHVDVRVGQGELVGEGDLHVAVGVLDALDEFALDVAGRAVQGVAHQAQHVTGGVGGARRDAAVDPVEVAQAVPLGEEPVAARGQGKQQVGVGFETGRGDEGEQQVLDRARGQRRLDDHQRRAARSPGRGVGDDGGEHLDQRPGEGFRLAFGGHGDEVHGDVVGQCAGPVRGHLGGGAGRSGRDGAPLLGPGGVDVVPDDGDALGAERFDGGPSDVAEAPDTGRGVLGQQVGPVIGARCGDDGRGRPHGDGGRGGRCGRGPGRLGGQCCHGGDSLGVEGRALRGADGRG